MHWSCVRLLQRQCSIVGPLLLCKALQCGVLPRAVGMIIDLNTVFAGPPPRLQIHSSSVLARTRPQWLVFWQVQQNASGWYEMQEVTAIESHWLPELADHVYSHTGIRAS